MKIENQKDRLEVLIGASLNARVIFGSITLFCLYKIINHFWMIYPIIAQYGLKSFHLSYSFLICFLAFFPMVYLASNKRKFIFTKEGIHMIFGPRAYAFFTLKEIFLPQNDINALVILPYRARQRGPRLYGLAIKRISGKNHFELFGLESEKGAFEIAHIIRQKLNLPNLAILSPKKNT